MDLCFLVEARSFRRSRYSRASLQSVQPDHLMTGTRTGDSIVEAEQGRGPAPGPDVAGEK
jgi:hypothetical protein